MSMNLQEFNELDESAAMEKLLFCCGCVTWASILNTGRPYNDFEELVDVADSEWWKLSQEDWKEAFAAHPKIGDKETLRQKFSNSKGSGWESHEQSGVNGASEDVLNALSALNDEYFKKFGFIFLICATGKTAEEMLQALQTRIVNGPEEEIAIAAAEQAKITSLRLKKLIAVDTNNDA